MINSFYMDAIIYMHISTTTPQKWPRAWNWQLAKLILIGQILQFSELWLVLFFLSSLEQYSISQYLSSVNNH